ncbi:unnamed protein product [Arabidopsis lyrata]|nr:unnamed protein product [Arabidopsis lyrata]
MWFSSLFLNMFYHLNIQLKTLFSFLTCSETSIEASSS